jgi:protein transport protein SEC23
MTKPKDIYDYEADDGIRFSWNVWPSNNLNATRIVVPVGCLYTPMKDIQKLPVLEYQALPCRGCGCVLNPFVYVDYKAKFWSCWNCQARNSFPQHYAEHISENNLPPELIPDYTTIEYDLPESVDTQIFLYVVDTAISAGELSELKDSIQQSLNLIPPESFVGLITYGRVVFVHELGFSEFSKSYAFDGTKQLTSQGISEQLGVFSKSDPRTTQPGKGMRRFILPLSECEFMFNSIIDDLQPDAWPVPSDERPLRATGSSAFVGMSMLKAFTNKGVRYESKSIEQDDIIYRRSSDSRSRTNSE